jgi:hypothetical protein
MKEIITQSSSIQIYIIYVPSQQLQGQDGPVLILLITLQATAYEPV